MKITKDSSEIQVIMARLSATWLKKIKNEHINNRVKDFWHIIYHRLYTAEYQICFFFIYLIVFIQQFTRLIY